MNSNKKLQALALGALFASVALFAIACTGAKDAAPATSTSQAQTAGAVQTIPVVSTSVAVQQTKGDAAVATGAAPAPLTAAVQPSAGDIVAAQEQAFTDIYEQTVPSVVHILIKQDGIYVGEGSGFVWDKDGHILTNYHVVQGSSGLRVLFHDGSDYDATVVGTDPDADLAVIKIDSPAGGLIPAVLGKSANVRPGQTAIAIGNPFGKDFTMTTGIVSAVGRVIDSGFSNYKIPAVIQTDAAINPGNSGGPLLDREGRVIGINTQIQSNNQQNSGVGFAVPIDLARRVAASLINKGRHDYSYLGISGQDVNRDIREAGRLPADIKGAIMLSVAPGSAAEKAGLKGDSALTTAGARQPRYDGDVIVTIGDTSVKSIDDVIAYLALNTSPGDMVRMVVVRAGREMVLNVTMGNRPR
ncbi:MAG: trypsin-like serine protease [Dehalococcoidia bacterium]|nr:trypsin-like serine protease [Dehalococcoidia bacterium]